MNDAQEFKILITGDAAGLVNATTQSAEATKGLAKQTETAGEKMEVTSGEARRLGNELGRAAGLGNLGALAMGGVAAAAFGAGKAVEFLRDTWNDIQSAIKGPLNLQVHDDAALIKANAEALNNYAEAERKAVEAANSPEATAGREEKALEHKLSLLKQIMKAEEEEALAALATHQGQMTPEAYAAAQGRIKSAFGQKSTEADEQAKAAAIAAKQKEAADLEADAARKKHDGDTMSTGNADAQGAAKKNAEAATKALEEINENIKMLNRIAHPDNAEYMGLGGKVQQQQDRWNFYKRYGYSGTQADAMAQEQTRKSQAESAIALGETATQQQERRQKRRGELLTQAGDESGKAANLREEIKSAIAEHNAEIQTHLGTEAIGGATRAIGQEQAAEGNNTPRGTRDALAALAAGTSAAANVQSQIQAVGNTNKELHDALFKALQDVAAENRRLAKLIRSMPGGNK